MAPPAQRDDDSVVPTIIMALTLLLCRGVLVGAELGVVNVAVTDPFHEAQVR